MAIEGCVGYDVAWRKAELVGMVIKEVKAHFILPCATVDGSTTEVDREIAFVFHLGQSVYASLEEIKEGVLDTSDIPPSLHSGFCHQGTIACFLDPTVVDDFITVRFGSEEAGGFIARLRPSERLLQPLAKMPLAS